MISAIAVIYDFVYALTFGQCWCCSVDETSKVNIWGQTNVSFALGRKCKWNLNKIDSSFEWNMEVNFRSKHTKTFAKYNYSKVKLLTKQRQLTTLEVMNVMML